MSSIRVKVVFNRTRPSQTVLEAVTDRTRLFLEPYNNHMKIVLQIVFKPWQNLLDQVYQLIPRHGRSSILVSVNQCITKYTVLEPCAQPCSVWDRLYLEDCLTFYVQHSSPIFIQQHSTCKHVYTIRVEYSVDPDQMAYDETIWSGPTLFSKEDKSKFSRT